MSQELVFTCLLVLAVDRYNLTTKEAIMKRVTDWDRLKLLQDCHGVRIGKLDIVQFTFYHGDKHHD